MSENIIETRTLPVVALRGLVVFPGMFLHFDVGRPKSIAAVHEAMTNSREIFLIAQKDIGVEDPGRDDLYDIGCIATVSQTLRTSNKDGGPARVAVEGLRRARLSSLTKGRRFLSGTVEEINDIPFPVDKALSEATVRLAKELFNDYCDCASQVSRDIINEVYRENEPGALADFIAGNIMLEYEDRQRVLENLDELDRLEDVCAILSRENMLLDLVADINDRVQSRIDDNQKEFFLREQLKAIGEELDGGEESEFEQFREKIEKLTCTDEVRERLLKSLHRLEKYQTQSPEAAVERNYLETCLDLPWGKYTDDKDDLDYARKVLDADHYGLEKVKERIIELLAVRKLNPDIKGQIICLVGPPGVGKTSIAHSVADAMGRKYARISLGGVKDEAEIRGHRKTYIGSMPGRIMDAVAKAGSFNPIILLDEVDKLSSDYKGDPTSALLEVLDPEQNNSFRDHYLEIPCDLSRVLFITTANLRQNIPEPLQDRMEIIELGSYTAEEKFHIAKEHLIKKQIKRHGLKASQLRFTDDAIKLIIDGYTREAGVRKLEQEIAAVCRKAAVKIADGTKSASVTVKNLESFIGPAKYKREKLSANGGVGIVNGLAWTQVGGEMLQVEVAVLEGSGKLELTGSLGDVMQESAKAAVSFIRSGAGNYDIPADFYKTKDIHIHFPEGATPKDGPSAGVTTATALLSALTGAAVRGDVAMTGEISLLGRVLPIGGLKEKSMAAYKAGIKKVIIPRDNMSDLWEIDEVVKENVEFIPAANIETVFANAMFDDSWRKIDKPVEKTVPVQETVKSPKRSVVRQ